MLEDEGHAKYGRKERERESETDYFSRLPNLNIKTGLKGYYRAEERVMANKDSAVGRSFRLDVSYAREQVAR